MPEQTPSFFTKSRRFWGMFMTAAAQFVPAIGPLVGLDVTVTEINEIAVAGDTALQAVGTFVGLAVTAWGSFVAQGPMTLSRS